MNSKILFKHINHFFPGSGSVSGSESVSAFFDPDIDPDPNLLLHWHPLL
jgi:hypothetical protein